METESMLQESTEPKKSKSKSIILLAILALVVIAGGFFGYNSYQASAKEKDEFAYAKNYWDAAYSMISGGATAEEVTNTYVSVWRDTIYDDQYVLDGKVNYSSDFNISLAAARKHHAAEIAGLIVNDEHVKGLMKKLNDPPKKYEKLHDMLLDMYTVYKAHTEMAEDPSGSLDSFSKSLRDNAVEFSSIWEKLNVMIPEDEAFKKAKLEIDTE
ncbi:hypothetical protein DRW41_10680 [Neobacillus piezotolerans]|uniref:Uncharacterized protein n=1 Tax=Neobacillus piezotolerans TaxID=2259171 RepID=A0A3D8GS33_9BACI|nr:hypothetical protein [Neobacillus piezotolerans]RDU37137.1 hypothetical protein DRW41_10680 [Neobacillus piezotolerans]